MNNVKNYNEFVNESLSISIFLFLGFIIGLVTISSLTFGPRVLRNIKIFFNKIKAVNSYRKQASEILNDLTPEQKKKLNAYIKHSAFAKWSSEETFYGVPPVLNIGENDPLGEEDWDDGEKREPEKIGVTRHNNPISSHGPLGPLGDTKFNGVYATGSEEEFFKEDKVKREKEAFLNLFDGDTKEKVEKLINSIDVEFQSQTMRDTSAWGVKDPNVGMQTKPNLDLRPLDLEHTEDRWDRKNKVFTPRYDKWGVLKKEYQ